MYFGFKPLFQLSEPPIEGTSVTVELAFLFTAVLLHELGHSALVWYSKGSSNSPKLGGIEEDAGDYYEKVVFGGVSFCEISKKDHKITKVGFHKGLLFYSIGES